MWVLTSLSRQTNTCRHVSRHPVRWEGHLHLGLCLSRQDFAPCRRCVPDWSTLARVQTRPPSELICSPDRSPVRQGPRPPRSPPHCHECGLLGVLRHLLNDADEFPAGPKRSPGAVPSLTVSRGGRAESPTPSPEPHVSGVTGSPLCGRAGARRGQGRVAHQAPVREPPLPLLSSAIRECSFAATIAGLSSALYTAVVS